MFSVCAQNFWTLVCDETDHIHVVFPGSDGNRTGSSVHVFTTRVTRWCSGTCVWKYECAWCHRLFNDIFVRDVHEHLQHSEEALGCVCLNSSMCVWLCVLLIVSLSCCSIFGSRRLSICIEDRKKSKRMNETFWVHCTVTFVALCFLVPGAYLFALKIERKVKGWMRLFECVVLSHLWHFAFWFPAPIYLHWRWKEK